MKIKFEHEITTDEAFEILLHNLNIGEVLDDREVYTVAEKEDGEKWVCKIKDGKELLIDDRGDLFIALRNVAVNLYPNLIFRNADYIYKENRTVRKEDSDLPDAPPVQMVTETFSGLLVNGKRVD